MSMTEAERFKLHDALRPVIGVDNSNTLMNGLPPRGWDDLTTKDDLSGAVTSLRAEMTSEFKAVRAEMKAMEDRLCDKIELTVTKAIAQQNKYLMGLFGSLVVALIVALTR